MDFQLHTTAVAPRHMELLKGKKYESEGFLSKFNSLYFPERQVCSSRWQIHFYLTKFDHVTYFIFTVNIT